MVAANYPTLRAFTERPRGSWDARVTAERMRERERERRAFEYIPGMKHENPRDR